MDFYIVAMFWIAVADSRTLVRTLATVWNKSFCAWKVSINFSLVRSVNKKLICSVTNGLYQQSSFYAFYANDNS